jgi:hypothetical protein
MTRKDELLLKIQEVLAKKVKKKNECLHKNTPKVKEKQPRDMVFSQMATFLGLR